MSEPYLILHKVRGEPAYDIATRLDEETWIIPTSGHRAYPFYKWNLYDLSDANSDPPYVNPINHQGWSEWPDHYQPSAAPRKAKPKELSLEDIGFVETKPFNIKLGRLT